LELLQEHDDYDGARHMTWSL